MYTFSTPEPTNLRVEHWSSGSVELIAEATDETTVELLPSGRGDAQSLIEEATVEQRGNEIVVLLPKQSGFGFFGKSAEVKVVVHLPSRSRVKAKTGSADVEAEGTLGDVDIETGSGDLQLEETEKARLRTGSGDIKVERAAQVTTKCGSGDVTLGSVSGDADLISGSGDVYLNQIAGRFKAKTGSGDLLLQQAGVDVDVMVGSGDLVVKRVDEGRVNAKSGSGDVVVGVREGTAAYLDIMTVSGDVTSNLDATEQPSDGEKQVELVIKSGSGDVVLQRA